MFTLGLAPWGQDLSQTLSFPVFGLAWGGSLCPVWEPAQEGQLDFFEREKGLSRDFCVPVELTVLKGL